MSVKTEPLRYDNCNKCVSRCEHAGKDREFVYRGDKLCKIVKKPHRIDRSAWDPCEYCGEPSPHWDCIIGDNVEQFLCSRDGLFRDAYIKQRKIEFCPYCGRPLTDTAWEMMEKRLESAKP